MRPLLSIVILIVLCWPVGTSGGESHQAWLHHSDFADFAGGTLEDGGANLYVTRSGSVRMIHTLDLNNDGYLDLFVAQDHDQVENEDLLIYWGTAQGPRSILPPLPDQQPLGKLLREIRLPGRRRHPAPFRWRRPLAACRPQRGRLPGDRLLQLHPQLLGPHAGPDLLGKRRGIRGGAAHGAAHPDGLRRGSRRLQPGRLPGPGLRQQRHRGGRAPRTRPPPGVLHLLERPHRVLHRAQKLHPQHQRRGLRSRGPRTATATRNWSSSTTTPRRRASTSIGEAPRDFPSPAAKSITGAICWGPSWPTWTGMDPSTWQRPTGTTGPKFAGATPRASRTNPGATSPPGAQPPSA